MNRVIQSALTIDDAIDQLNELREVDPTARLFFVCDYGDHAHTEQALPVTEIVAMTEDEVLAKTGYSRSGFCLEEAKYEVVAPVDGALKVLKSGFDTYEDAKEWLEDNKAPNACIARSTNKDAVPVILLKSS